MARTNQTKVVRVQRIVEVDEATNEDAENLEIAMGNQSSHLPQQGLMYLVK